MLVLPSSDKKTPSFLRWREGFVVDELLNYALITVQLVGHPLVPLVIDACVPRVEGQVNVPLDETPFTQFVHPVKEVCRVFIALIFLQL